MNRIPNKSVIMALTAGTSSEKGVTTTIRLVIYRVFGIGPEYNNQLQFHINRSMLQLMENKGYVQNYLNNREFIIYLLLQQKQTLPNLPSTRKNIKMQPKNSRQSDQSQIVAKQLYQKVQQKNQAQKIIISEKPLVNEQKKKYVEKVSLLNNKNNQQDNVIKRWKKSCKFKDNCHRLKQGKCIFYHPPIKSEIKDRQSGKRQKPQSFKFPNLSFEQIKNKQITSQRLPDSSFEIIEQIRNQQVNSQRQRYQQKGFIVKQTTDSNLNDLSLLDESFIKQNKNDLSMDSLIYYFLDQLKEKQYRNNQIEPILEPTKEKNLNHGTQLSQKVQEDSKKGKRISNVKTDGSFECFNSSQSQLSQQFEKIKSQH